jgi:hypothetical protein
MTDRKGTPVIVELQGGDMLVFRMKCSKRRYEIYLGHCFRLAQITQADADFKQRSEQYQMKKKAGFKGLRKPKRSALPYNNLYFKALKQ